MLLQTLAAVPTTSRWIQLERARLVLHVALEIMHNKIECWFLVIQGCFLVLTPEQMKVKSKQ